MPTTMELTTNASCQRASCQRASCQRASCQRPGFPVNRRLDVMERMPDAHQALRVPDQQVAAGLQELCEVGHHALLRRLVEIDHDVAAEDDREGAGGAH